MTITLLGFPQVSKKMGAKNGSAVVDLATSAMKEVGNLTKSVTKKVMPKALDSDTLVIGGRKNTVNMCGAGSYFDSCTAGLSV